MNLDNFQEPRRGNDNDGDEDDMGDEEDEGAATMERLWPLPNGRALSVNKKNCRGGC